MSSSVYFVLFRIQEQFQLRHEFLGRLQLREILGMADSHSFDGRIVAAVGICDHGGIVVFLAENQINAVVYLLQGMHKIDIGGICLYTCEQVF